MNYYKRICGLLFLVIAFGMNIQAQELTIGDTLPECGFGSVLRYGAPTVRLSQFRGKILILDLWRTTCGHCLSSFAHFDSLTAAFNGQVAALAITTEKRSQIEAFIADNGFVKKTRIPMVTDDTLLAGKRFTFIYIPHVVVVNGKGIIVAITEPEKVTPGVIRNVLAGQPVHLPVKKEITDFNFDVPVLAEGNGRNLDRLAYTSTLTHGLPGVTELTDMDTSGNRIFYKAYNMTIPDLYAQAYHFFLTPNRLVLTTRDSSRFFLNTDDDADIQSQHLWVYNLVLPAGYPHPERYALEDFTRFFGTEGHIEKRRVACWVLTRTGNGERWRSKGETGYYTDSAGLMLIHNVTLYNVCTSWDMSFPMPVINETGLYNELAHLTLPDKPDDLATFRKKLRQYDLDLVPAMREVSMLVISDRTEPKDNKE